jgi:hypothetical protein
MVLVVPLAVFTGMARGWFEGDRHLGLRDVGVELSNFQIDLSRDEIAAGDMTFVIDHDEGPGRHGSGQPGEHHDVVIAREDDAGGLTIVARSKMLENGQSEDLSVRLDPGTYVLFCSVVEEVRGHTVSHQEEGMVTRLTVTTGDTGEAARR